MKSSNAIMFLLFLIGKLYRKLHPKHCMINAEMRYVKSMFLGYVGGNAIVSEYEEGDYIEYIIARRIGITSRNAESLCRKAISLHSPKDIFFQSNNLFFTIGARL